MKNRILLMFGLGLSFLIGNAMWLVSSTSLAQDFGGGGRLVRDLTGGAALIFRAPQNPLVYDAVSGGQVGGGRTRGGDAKPPVKKQDQAIARANAARSAAKPRYSEALQQYELAAQIAPDDARAFAGQGNVYVDQGRFSEAVDAYKKALNLNPNYQAAYLPLAFSLARLNRFPESLDLYLQTLKDDPTNPEILNNLSFVYNHSGRYQDAVDASLQAIKFLGETGEAYKVGFQERNEIRSYAYKNLGNAYNGLKRYDEAANALKKAAEIEPTNVSAHFNLGLTLFNAGRYSEAIAAYKEAIRLRPTLAQAHFNLGITYHAMNDRASALAEYEALKGINPEMAQELYAIVKQQ